MNDMIGIVVRGVARLAVTFAFAGARSLVARAETSANPTEDDRLALKICVACHAVGPDQQARPVLCHPASNFQTIAGKLGTTAASLQQFILTTHAEITRPEGIPNPQLTPDQAADIPDTSSA